MANPLEVKAHQLLGQLGPSQLAVVVQLLEAMVQEDEELTEEDSHAVAASREYFRQGGEDHAAVRPGSS